MYNDWELDKEETQNLPDYLKEWPVQMIWIPKAFKIRQGDASRSTNHKIEFLPASEYSIA